jgi:hypothetical protein
VFTSPEFSRIWVKCTMIAAMLLLLQMRDHDEQLLHAHGEHGHNKELVRSQYGDIDFLTFFHAKFVRSKHVVITEVHGAYTKNTEVARR